VTDLIVSLSGLSDDLSLAPGFAAALDGRGVPLTHLLRPAGAAPELVDWVRERCRRGDALALHGYDHTPRPLGTTRGRKGEFAELPAHEAGLRLTAARRALTALSLRTDVFVPPRWLASGGTVDALVEQGFRVLADDAGVRDLARGTVEAARVLGFRAAGEHWLLGAELAWTLRRGGAVRINVRAKDLRKPGRAEAVLTAVDAALAQGVAPTCYRRTVRRAA
jgi:predicted deacetylase